MLPKRKNGMHLDNILDALHKHGQRATYAAVGGLVGAIPLSVMRGREKNNRNSWVVTKEKRMPTGNSSAETDSRLAGSAKPIESSEALLQWLNLNT